MRKLIFLASLALGVFWASYYAWAGGSVETGPLGQASAVQNGYLGSSDWVTFNNSSGCAGQPCVPPTRAIATSSPLTGGGDLSTNRTFGITQAGNAGNGYLSSTDWQAFNAKVGTARSVATTAPLAGGGSLAGDLTLSMALASNTSNGYLASVDWLTFNAKQTALSAASNSVSGYLTSTDWATFNGKQPTVSASAPITFSSNTVAIPKADATHSGYLSSTDWATFNSAGGTVNEATEKFTLSGTDISNGYVTLAHTPATAGNVHLFKKAGLPQVYGDDFSMLTATHLQWLALTVISGDILVANYLY